MYLLWRDVGVVNEWVSDLKLLTCHCQKCTPGPGSSVSKAGLRRGLGGSRNCRRLSSVKVRAVAAE